MKSKTAAKQDKRTIRHRRIRARVAGTAERPRLAVYRSNRRLVAQLIDDEAQVTLTAVSSDAVSGKTPRERAEASGTAIAEAAKAKGVSSVVFDRGGFQYLGSIKVFADAARTAGLQF